ncbi:MAG TPA: type II secretion system F family protein [Jiangellaceae bacterium]
MEASTAVLFAAGSVGLALALTAYALTAQPDAARVRARANLQRGMRRSGSPQDDVHGQSGLVGLARRLTPAGNVRRLDLLLARAGRPAAWPLERVLVTKLLLTAAVAGLMALMLLGSPSGRTLLFSVAVVVLAWFVPDLLLISQGQKRREEIQKSLPDTLDQMTIAVEAGLGFEAAMAYVARNSQGALAEELIRTLQDIQVGQPRREAYRALAERSPEPDLRRFLRAVVQAEQHGVSVARVLSTQAQEMRVKRRQRAEEKAMKIPVKVVFPLILTILPVLIIVVIGPGVINMIDAFSN